MVSTLREIPRRSTKSSKRRTPRNASRRISNVHHSPTISERLGDGAVHVGERRLPHGYEPYLSCVTGLNCGMLRSMTQLTGSAAVTEFDRTTALIPVEDRPGEFLVDLDAGWSSLVGVHGGYMCALAVRAAESLAPGRAMRTMSTSFLRTGRVGPATLSVREVRQGRTITTMVAELVQDDQILIVSRLTLMTARSGVEWSEPRPLELPPPADCVPFDAARSRGELRTVRACGSTRSGCRSPATAPTSAATCARSKLARSMPPGWSWRPTASRRRRSPVSSRRRAG